MWEMIEKFVSWACQHPWLLVTFLSYSAWVPQLRPGEMLEEETKSKQTKLLPTYLTILGSLHSHPLCTQVLCRISQSNMSSLLPVCTCCPFPSVTRLMKNLIY